MQPYLNRDSGSPPVAEASSPPDPDDRHLHCPLCGQRHALPQLQQGQRAQCIRCGTTMAERGWFGPDGTLVFALTGLALAVPSLLLPFVTLRKFGSERVSHLAGSFEGLWAHGFGTLGLWVLYCGTLAPCALLTVVIVICWNERRKNIPPWHDRLIRLAQMIETWAIPEVQVLGVMVAFFKLGDIVTVSVGPGLWCFGATSFFALLAWRRLSLQLPRRRSAMRASPEHSATINPPSVAASRQAAALAISAVILLFPAYALPVMHLGMAAKTASDTTIFSGIVQLWKQGLGGLAAIVFTASFLVPLLKLAGLGVLLLTAWRNNFAHSRFFTRLYGAIDFIGRWSMLDVFLVAFLTGAVRFGKLASVQPRAGIVAFAAVVVLTMIATHRFDPRLLWADAARKTNT